MKKLIKKKVVKKSVKKVETKKAVKKAVKKEVKKKEKPKKKEVKKRPSLVKRVKDLLFEGTRTDDQISKVLVKEYPDRKRNDVSSVAFYRWKINLEFKKNIKELVKKKVDGRMQLVPKEKVAPVENGKVEKKVKKERKVKTTKENVTKAQSKKSSKKVVKKKVSKKKGGSNGK